MAYNTPPTKNTGDTFSASEFNTYIRDNMAAGVPDIFEAAGDLAVGSGADAAMRLAKGQIGQLLRVLSNGSVGWGGPLIQRYGSNANDWTQPGSTIYIPENIFFQLGLFTISSIAANNSYAGGIMFNTAFGGAPLVFCSAMHATHNITVVVQSTSTTNVVFSVFNNTSSTASNVKVIFMAIGPSA